MCATLPSTGVLDICVNIGAQPITLRTTDRAFGNLLKARYSKFLGDPPASGVTFDIDLTEARPSSDRDIEVSGGGTHWSLERGDFNAEWDFETLSGSISQSPNPYSIDSLLRVVHTLMLAREGGFLLHSASAVRNGNAFLFSGLSGAGKTTISRLAPKDAELLTDEISYVRHLGGSYRAFGTPFAGELGRPGANISAPVTALYFLRKAPTNSIEPVQPGDALRLLMRNVLFFSHDPTHVQLVFEAACAFVSALPVFWLSFFPDRRVWEVIG